MAGTAGHLEREQQSERNLKHQYCQQPDPFCRMLHCLQYGRRRICLFPYVYMLVEPMFSHSPDNLYLEAKFVGMDPWLCEPTPDFWKLYDACTRCITSASNSNAAANLPFDSSAFGPTEPLSTVTKALTPTTSGGSEPGSGGVGGPGTAASLAGLVTGGLVGAGLVLGALAALLFWRRRRGRQRAAGALPLAETKRDDNVEHEKA